MISWFCSPPYATGSGSLPSMQQIRAGWSPSTCSPDWESVVCFSAVWDNDSWILSDAVYSDEQVGSSREIGHRPGGCGRRRRGAPPPQLLAAADDTYLVGSGGWGQQFRNWPCIFFHSGSKPKRNNLHVPRSGCRWFLGAWFTRLCRSTRGRGRSKVCSHRYDCLLQGADDWGLRSLVHRILI